MLSGARFTILGSGTSAGVPIIGCDCRVCTSNDIRNHRWRSGACVQFTDASGHPRTILIDTSPDLRAQALQHRLSRCDAIVYTHHHVDHTFGLDEVRRFNAVMQSPIDVYADAHTLANLKRVYQHIFESHRNRNASFVATLIAHEIDVAQRLNLHGLIIEPIQLLHGRLPILGFRMERVEPMEDDPIFPLAYCTDVSSIPPETWPRLMGLKTLFLDALRYRHHPTHFTIDQAVEAAGHIDARQTFFVHMTHDIEHAHQDALLPERMALAYDGLCLSEDQVRS